MSFLRIIDAFHKDDLDFFEVELTEHLKTYNVDHIIQYASRKITLLSYATSYNNFDIVKLLVTKYKADINNLDAFNIACKYQYNDIIIFLCSYGAQVCLEDIKNLISNDDSYEQVKYIIEKNPGIDFGNEFILSLVKDNRLIPFLIEKGALVTLTHGYNIFVNIIANKNTTKKTIQILFDAIKRSKRSVYDYVRLVDIYKHETILHHISTCEHPEQIIPLFVNNGADINAVNIYKQTPLFYACNQNIKNASIISVLLKYGANPNITDTYNNTALFGLFDTKNLIDKSILYNVLDMFISAGVDLELCTRADYRFHASVLMLAVKNLHLKMVKYLVSKGANLHFITPQGNGVVNILIESYHYDKNLQSNWIKMLKYLIQQKCSLLNCPEDTSPPWITAVSKVYPVKILSIIIKNLNSTDINNLDIKGFSALHYACKYNVLPLVKLLVRKGAIINRLNWSKIIYSWTIDKVKLIYPLLYYLYKHDPSIFTDELIEKLQSKTKCNLQFLMLKPIEISNNCIICKRNFNVLYDLYCEHCIQYDHNIHSKIEFY